MASLAQGYIIFYCTSRELQTRAGFDGWVMLLRDEFDTEDQAWPQEKLRLAGIAKRKMRKLEAGGIELDMLQLATSCHILLEPPPADRQEERIWCIEFFRGKMYDFVADDRELVERLNSFQDELLQSARLGAPLSPSSPAALRVRFSSSPAASARPSGDDAACAPPGSPGQEHASGELRADAPSAERKHMSVASLSAALDLSELDAHQRSASGGGAFLPILPLATDEDSVDRGLATLPTSTARWGVM
jgi:hypothetical protein